MLAALAGCGGKAVSQPATKPAAPPLQRYEYSQVLMGVQVRLVLYTTDEEAAKSAARAAFERVSRLEEIMSDYITDSELMRLSRTSGSGRAVEVSPELFDVVEYGQKVAEATDGAFDVTVGPVIQLWRKARKSKTLPDTAALADARSRTGWRRMVLDARSRSVTLTTKGMRLDLGGVAKGYAGDEALRVLREHGVASALFEAGGDIVVSDPPPGKNGWHIETEDGRAYTLANQAISTSGDTFQSVEIGGVIYSHVVDPRTGVGLTDHYAATVIAPRGITTDALSTACTVLGPTKSQALVKNFGATAFVRKMARETTSRQPSTTSRVNP
jgi:thiamine biosynthesis lipoprotein